MAESCPCCKLYSLLPALCWNKKSECECACADCNCNCNCKHFYGLKWKCLSLGISRQACEKASNCCGGACEKESNCCGGGACDDAQK